MTRADPRRQTPETNPGRLTGAEPVATAACRPKTRLGFNTRVSFDTGEAARGLREGIELFQTAGCRHAADRTHRGPC